MEKQKDSPVCLTCGTPVPKLMAECPRCSSVDQLIQELLHKQASQIQGAGMRW